jgi:hypothetical protein
MSKKIHLNFEIDKLTNSIQNRLTEEVFETIVNRLTSQNRNLIKPEEWIFEWHKELQDSTKEVYTLSTMNNSKIIHGLISFSDKKDHIFMHLIENAKFNKGINKLYNGVAGNLVAFCCKISFEREYEGVVSFIAKSKLIKHYQETLGAKFFGKNRMFIDTKEASILVKQYYQDFSHGKF